MTLVRTLFNRLRGLRQDDRGNVTLLSGIMAFMIAILGLYVRDTNRAIYNRIQAQNAADAAAETAALIQARGLNLLQHLNNVHYAANWAVFAAEELALLACVPTPVLQLAEDVACTIGEILGPEVCEGAQMLMKGACTVCSQAGPINNFQKKMATTILGLQKVIKNLFPVLAFLHANEVAGAAGGDDVKVVLPQYVKRLGQEIGNLGLPIPSEVNDSMFSGFMQAAAGVLTKLPPLYAFPLDPGSLSLHVKEVDGDALPWKWPDWLKTAALVEWDIGKYTCTFDPWQFGAFAGKFEGFDSSDKWGWDDKYYAGHPGFMTWLTGKKSEKELAGLDTLRWLKNPGKSENNDMKTMYSGEHVEAGEPSSNWIPAVIGIASSQVEGDGVVDHGDILSSNPDNTKANSRQRIIPVYFTKKFSGLDVPLFPIYH